MRRAFVWMLAAAASACGGEAGKGLYEREAPEPLPTRDPAAAAAERIDAGFEVPESLPDPPPAEPEPFDEPGCPPVPPRANINQCDPLASPSGCPDGQSCYPFVDYPSGPCDVEVFGAVCAPSGSGLQGDSCSRERCAPEHICVSTGRGTQCVRLCSLADGAPDVCGAGLLCLPIDIEGFGGCL